MAGTIYGLIIGIDRYASNIGNLDYAVENAEKFHDYLCGNLRYTNNLLAPICNRAATRARIIRELQSFRRAKKGDVCLFYFAGHGSSEKAPAALRHLGYNLESLVCADSRTNGVCDLADKELACLIYEITRNGARFVAVIDSCHSGDSTRIDDTGPKKRTIASNRSSRDLEELYGYGRYGKNYPPIADHVLLAACSPGEDVLDDRDGFTKKLIDVLEEGRYQSFREVMTAVKQRVQKERATQNPGIFPRDTGLQNDPFLFRAFDFTTRP